MADRPAGSFIDDGSGILRPNLDDEAMKARVNQGHFPHADGSVP